jgi:hypothetical protein
LTGDACGCHLEALPSVIPAKLVPAKVSPFQAVSPWRERTLPRSGNGVEFKDTVNADPLDGAFLIATQGLTAGCIDTDPSACRRDFG